MNILPITIAFLLIFSYITCSLMKGISHTYTIAIASRGYALTEYQLQNALVKRSVLQHKKKDPAVSKQMPRKPKQYIDQRESFPPRDRAKLYLRALLSLPAQGPSSIEILAELLRVLYQNVLSIKGLEYTLAQSLLLNAEQSPKETDLAALYPQDPDLQMLYYKMLRGTEVYDLEKQQGVPPLSHFLSLEPATKVAFFSFASRPVLSALWGEQTAAAICLLEQERSYARPCDKEELVSVLLKHAPAGRLVIEPHLNYSKQYGARHSIARRHALTGIQIEKVL